MIALTVLCALLGQVGDPAVGEAQRVPAVVSDGAAWVKGRAIVPAFDASGQGLDDLAGLDALVGGARVVSLGEPTHGTAEAFSFKHRLLEYLVERKGFRLFSIEASMPESFALNQYVLEGEGDPRTLIAGMYFWTWNTEEVLAMVEWMRAWNLRNPAGEGRLPLLFTGFDMQTPDVAWGISDRFIKTHAPELAEKSASVLPRAKALMQRASIGSTAGGFTSATATFPPDAARGKTARLSCWIKTEGVDGWAGAWWRCDTPDGVNGFANMADQGAKGDTGWRRYELTVKVPQDVENINFGFILSGKGAAWFDDVEIELDGTHYIDEKRFSLGFEDPAVQFLSPVSGEYQSRIVKKDAHGGERCLEIRRRPLTDVPEVDAPALEAQAKHIVEALVAQRDSLVAKAGARETDWAIQNARVVYQCVGMYGSSNGFAHRDRCMAENVMWILGQHPGQKIVLWAHNGHVSRAGFGTVRSMGTHLARELGDEMVVVGFAAGRGKYTAMKTGSGLTSDNDLAPPPMGSVESVFEAAGLARAVIDIRGASPDDLATRWAATRRPMRSIGAVAMESQFTPVVAARAYDVLVWQAHTTASKPLKKQ